MTPLTPASGERLASIARGLPPGPDTDATLRRAVTLVQEHLPSADFVSVSLLAGRRTVVTPASTAPAAERADQVQYDLDTGPCLDALRTESPVLVADLETDTSYPGWSAVVRQETGIRSSFSAPLHSGPQVLGAVNVYSAHAHGFDEADRLEVLAAGDHLAMAFAASRQLSGLRDGLEGRTVIGQAQGILMERFKIPAERAFDLLSRVSQNTNTRLREVAARLVATGETPARPHVP